MTGGELTASFEVTETSLDEIGFTHKVAA